jgi:hypothetical protein
VNDLGGTLIDENISRAAGAQHGQHLTEQGFRELVEPLGRRLVQRTTLYEAALPRARSAEPTAHTGRSVRVELGSRDQSRSLVEQPS